ncbi:DEAD-box ATP-dependent RNA helicase 38-like [Zingiber officinale]|uniref:DEAD-box ATP-dependent RNA helicase 38-like n=1 Tax=Zingiber officinale TaxID=94328 RepID=UPI001C4C9C17|nr:DEAD-box ATP-dependent RNA helicase 38-like [Zingiber officinale]
MADSESATTKTEPKLSWADVESDEEKEASALSSEAAVPSELNKIESLSIADVKDGENQAADVPDASRLLEDPDESDIKAVTSGDTVYTSAVAFEDLNLSNELINGLYVEMGFSRPSKIQAITLPMILTPPYKDLVAQAHNGSGKTTCFVLGMLSRVDPSKKVPQAICVCPTRELAQQNHAVLMKMGKYTGITAMCAIPTDSSSYIPINKRPPVTDQVVIGTPGTIKKWTTAKKLSTRDIKILVFDEADHMLAEDGFRDDSERLRKEIQRSSGGCQVLLFSATFNENVKAFVSRVIYDGNQIFVKKEELTLEKVKQYKVLCPNENAKIEVIKNKIFEFGQKVGQTIIFVRTRHSASMLHRSLSQEGYECTSVQGALSQEDRDKIIKEFKDGLTKVLITTDLLARGFDQRQVNLVINYDLPVKHTNPSEPDCELYLHRVGRTGRFGSKGAVFNFLCTDRDKLVMEKIQQHFQHPIPEISDWRSEEAFESALKDAGLL